MKPRGLAVVLRGLRAFFPRGYALDDAEWKKRHLCIQVVLWMHVVAAGCFAYTTGYGFRGAFASAAVVAAFALGAMLPLPWRRVRSLLTTLGLLMATSIFVYFAHGLTEVHFNYFVTLGVVAFYQDWTTFLVAIFFVLVQHSLMGIFNPSRLYDYSEHHRHGPWFWAMVHSFFLSCSTAAILGFWRLAEDASAMAVRLAQDVARQEGHSQRMESIGRLASGVAHEINAPLQYVSDNLRFTDKSMHELAMVVRSYRRFLSAEQISQIEGGAQVDMILRELPQAIEQSLAGIERSSQVVKAMNSFSHPGEVIAVDRDLNEALRNDVVVAGTQIDRNVAIEVNLGDLPLVKCHLGELSQVFLNLIVNASHAIADNVACVEPKITVTSRAADGGALVAISDTGTGIPDEVAPFIFDPFFTTKDVGKGTGQGLALAYSVITKRHAGKIWFDSTLNVGTTFYVWLPASPTNSSGAMQAKSNQFAV